MLQPREADIPALFLVLVVLPLVTYFLLGIWNEAVKRKARMSMLAQIAAEEACRVEEMSSVDAMPIVTSLRTGIQECARCFAPATTRCSRCKSVRYCSGKCQIIHWRQGHKQECHNWKERTNNYGGQQSFPDNLKSPSYCSENSFYNDFPGELSDDSSIGMTDASQDSEIQLGKRTINKLKRSKSKVDDPTVLAIDESNRHFGDGGFSPDFLFSETTSRDRLEHKSGMRNFNSHDVFYKDQHSGSSSAAKNAMPPYNVAGPRIDEVKQSSSASSANLFHLNKHAINESETDLNLTSESSHEAGFSSTETVDSSYSSQINSAKGGKMYKKPPYILRQSTSSQQSSTENNSREYSSQGTDRKAYKENGPRFVQRNISTNTLPQKSYLDQNEGNNSGSKKTSKVSKRNLVGLINDNKRTKICRLLFPYDDLVKYFRCEIWGISPRGLMNCGNSCYANAVLQCLTSTKPLLVYLLRRSHSRTCLVKDWCLMCELEHHVSLLREDGGHLSPSRILSNMRNIGCRLGGGDQEDAHEFLRLLVMSMQSICLEGLGGEKEVDPRLQETTLIQQIFGGRLKSKVKCLRCLLESECYENIMDLTLEIHGWVESLEDALTQFTSPEDLDGENMYRCGRCSAYVKARKQLSLHEVPNILTIVLKRFQSGKYGKINKCVTFPDMLDMIPFVTGTADKPPLYLLYAVIVHLDNFNASFSGHYISYVKDLQGTWFRIDDLEVQAVQPSQVMSEGAYMLFYSRSSPRPPRAYIETTGIQDPTNARQTTSKMLKPPRHERHKQSEVLFGSENSMHLRNNFKPDYEESVIDPAAKYSLRYSSRPPPTQGSYSDSVSKEFGDSTSSDWSLFTSSDESSFTTESTRDSFSTVDNGDNASLDALSLIFSPYIPEYSQDNMVSCKKVSPCRPQTRFFSESMGCVVDPPVPTQSLGNVHRGRNL